MYKRQGLEIASPNGTGGISQKVPGVTLREDVTFSVKDADGFLYTLSCTVSETEQVAYFDASRKSWMRVIYTNGYTVVSIFLDGGSKRIKWAKLEKGSVATPYVPKDYGSELAECMRYYIPPQSVELATEQIYRSQFNGALHIVAQYPVPMRGTPIVSVRVTYQKNVSGAEKKTVSAITMRGITPVSYTHLRFFSGSDGGTGDLYCRAGGVAGLRAGQCEDHGGAHTPPPCAPP